MRWVEGLAEGDEEEEGASLAASGVEEEAVSSSRSELERANVRRGRGKGMLGGFIGVRGRAEEAETKDRKGKSQYDLEEKVFLLFFCLYHPTADVDKPKLSCVTVTIWTVVPCSSRSERRRLEEGKKGGEKVKRRTF
jgi:hypothetical protein